MQICDRHKQILLVLFAYSDDLNLEYSGSRAHAQVIHANGELIMPQIIFI
jgi:hypothetical protein